MDLLILFPSRIADDALRAARQLKLIQLVSAGFDQMNIGLCNELGIPIANNGGTNAIDVAEHTIAMILAHYRRFREMDPNVRNDGWRAIDSGQTTYTIEGKTIGIVGLGKIGQRLATLLGPWGARLLFYDPFPPAEEIQRALNVQQTPLNELLQQSDIVTLHVPLSPDTDKLIGAEQLALMQPHALLVNTCRGPVVDETALIQALRNHQIAGAALDVLEAEPPALDNPLFDLDNVLLTPHTAGVTRDTWPRRGAFIFENLQRVWNGEAPMAVVNPGYQT
ncbi:2-hydroxyacid dehydrogenase [Chloroflexi bacterium TSY]|nr:2-hydroxyacid dehydrogenase [Chloroflexi bacterium TSY]